MITEKLEARRLIKSLNSMVCPACGDLKKRAQTLCLKHYRALPVGLRKALYNRVGDGYEEAVTEALNYLGFDDFLDPD